MKKSVEKGIIAVTLIHLLLWCFLLLAILIVSIFVEPPKNLHGADLKAWSIGFELITRYFAVLTGAGFVSSVLLFLSFRGIFRSCCKKLNTVALWCSGMSTLIVYLVGIISFIGDFDSILSFILVVAILWFVLSLSGGVLLWISARKARASESLEKV